MTDNPTCMLYSVYAVLGVCCTWCMLYLMYAALSVNSWWWHGEIERDDLTLCSCDDGRVVDEKERDGGWGWERYGGYERVWDIRSTTCLIGFRRPRIGVITRRIGTRTCRIGDGQLTHTQNSLSPSVSWWFPPSSMISLCLVLNSTITWEQEVKSSHSISPCHNHEITPSTAYTKYSIIPRSTDSRSQPVSHLSADVVLNSLHSHNYKLTNESSLSCRRVSLPPPPSIPPISLDHSLQVHLRSRSVTASQCISKLDRSRPPSASPRSLHLSLQVHLETCSITASQCISKLDQPWTPSVSLRSNSGCTEILG